MAEGGSVDDHHVVRRAVWLLVGPAGATEAVVVLAPLLRAGRWPAYSTLINVMAIAGFGVACAVFAVREWRRR